MRRNLGLEFASDLLIPARYMRRMNLVLKNDGSPIQQINEYGKLICFAIGQTIFYVGGICLLENYLR